MSKLILIMIDGISADLFVQAKAWLPNLHALASQGTYVKALTPEVCGTSFPGRTSMIAGQTAAEHGVYGNKVWDGTEFRWAIPEDVLTTTVAGYAKQANKKVAGLGYGMVNTQDCDLYLDPWWSDETTNRARNYDSYSLEERKKQQDNQDFKHALAEHTKDTLKTLDAAIYATKVINPNGAKYQDYSNTETMTFGMLADQQLLDIGAALACSDDAPDLILLEIAATDYFLHKYGAGDPMMEHSLRTADAQVGTLLERLRQAGKLDEYNFAIMSDHGHTAMTEAIYCDQILPEGVPWSSEGGMLLIAPRSQTEAEKVTKILLEAGLETWNKDFIPKHQQDELLIFTSKEGALTSFERDLKGTGQISGKSKYQSNHGMRPGSREDYRFCLFVGPDVPQQEVEFATASQVAPTLASILKIETPWLEEPLC
ncbi:MAG: alkaline phosphatase family protein [Marinomonas sp.]